METVLDWVVAMSSNWTFPHHLRLHRPLLGDFPGREFGIFPVTTSTARLWSPPHSKRRPATRGRSSDAEDRATELFLPRYAQPARASPLAPVVSYAQPMLAAARCTRTSPPGCRASSALRFCHPAQPPLLVAHAACAVEPTTVAVGIHGDAGGGHRPPIRWRRWGKLLLLHLLSSAGDLLDSGGGGEGGCYYFIEGRHTGGSCRGEHLVQGRLSPFFSLAFLISFL
jgi:hypothetical protein